MNYYPNRVESRCFDPFFADMFGLKEAMSSDEFGSLAMKTDVQKAENGYTLDIELPGVKKEDISISYEDDYLTVKASAKTLKKNEKGEATPFLHRERFAGSALRSYYVGDIDQNLVKANFSDGVLTVFVPNEKVEEETSHQIAIN